MKDVWRSAITTSGVLSVTVVLTQVMPEQRVVKLVILENLLVGLITFSVRIVSYTNNFSFTMTDIVNF